MPRAIHPEELPVLILIGKPMDCASWMSTNTSGPMALPDTTKHVHRIRADTYGHLWNLLVVGELHDDIELPPRADSYWYLEVDIKDPDPVIGWKAPVGAILSRIYPFMNAVTFEYLRHKGRAVTPSFDPFVPVAATFYEAFSGWATAFYGEMEQMFTCEFSKRDLLRGWHWVFRNTRRTGPGSLLGPGVMGPPSFRLASGMTLLDTYVAIERNRAYEPNELLLGRALPGPEPFVPVPPLPTPPVPIGPSVPIVDRLREQLSEIHLLLTGETTTWDTPGQQERRMTLLRRLLAEAEIGRTFKDNLEEIEGLRLELEEQANAPYVGSTGPFTHTISPDGSSPWMTILDEVSDATWDDVMLEDPCPAFAHPLHEHDWATVFGSIDSKCINCGKTKPIVISSLGDIMSTDGTITFTSESGDSVSYPTREVTIESVTLTPKLDVEVVAGHEYDPFRRLFRRPDGSTYFFFSPDGRTVDDDTDVTTFSDIEKGYKRYKRTDGTHYWRPLPAVPKSARAEPAFDVTIPIGDEPIRKVKFPHPDALFKTDHI